MNRTWTVLQQRAETATQEAQGAMQTARSKVIQLESSLAHIDKLKVDYLERYSVAQKETHSIGDNIAYRRFIDHLNGLRHRVLGQLSAAQKGLEATQVVLVNARREQAKMEAMVEREARNDAAAEAKKDQRVLDETGIRLFNLKS
jgi:flagellar export protein FliJ